MTISRADNEKEVNFSLLTEPGFLKCGLGMVSAAFQCTEGRQPVPAPPASCY